MSDLLNFSQALNELKAGHKIARDGWNGKNMFVLLLEPAGFESCLALKNASGKMQPGWAPSQPDLLAEDWRVV